MSDRDLATPEPDDRAGSLNHLDFGRPKLSWAVRKAVSMLPEGKQRLLYAAAAVQVLLGVLDLVGIALIGLVAAVAVSGIGSSSIPPIAHTVLNALGLGNLTVSQLSVVLALAAVIILVAKTALSAFMTRRITMFLAHRQSDLSASLARRFLRRPLSDVQRWTTNEAIYALGQGAGAATIALLGLAIIIASEVFLFAIIAISLLIYDPVVTIASGLFFGVVVIALQRGLGAWTSRNAAIFTSMSVETLNAVSEAISTYREATVLHRRDLYVDRYENVVSKYARASATSTYIAEVPKFALEAALYIGVLVLAVAQFLTRNWGAAASTTALFLAAGSRVIPSLLRLQGAAISIRNASVMAQPTFFMFDFLNESAPDTSPRITSQALHAQIVKGYADFSAYVRVRDVCVTFLDAGEPALDGVSFDLPQGQSMALVGSTGAGKSTLSDVVLGILEPSSGEVSIGGLHPREAIRQWPGAISYVPQLVALVPGTVRQNVALGLPDEVIDDDLVWDALRRAHIADFLGDEREGLDTYIGERGFKLSGGQRQRLGLARALYTRPRLLVLDEATSALDGETEKAIIQTLAELEGQVTTITVAHRLATVRNVDEVLYIDRGRIVARGTFNEVRAQSPEFNHQATLLGL